MVCDCYLSTSIMFFKICRSSTADEDAHRRSDRRDMPIMRNAFQNQGRKISKAVNSGPVKAGYVQTGTDKTGKRRRSHSGRTGARKDFFKLIIQGLGAEESYCNPERLPSFEAAYQNFKQAFPRFKETFAVDVLREREYEHLREREHVCFDYIGFGLFSHRQQVYHRESSSFGLAYISANLSTHALYGTAEEATVEAYIKRRIMTYMNLSDLDYSMVFTASRGTAYKLLAESYPFNMNKRLLTVYDNESDAVSWMAGIAKEKGAEIMNASFKWPNMKIAAPDLKYKLQDKKKKDQTAEGLFVFPVQSRVTGAKYSYQWMSQAQANKWHVLLDASALAPKDMDSLALSLFRPEFIVTSFYRVFGADPTGFGCLFIKNSIIQGLHNSDRARGVGMVRIISSGVSNTLLRSVKGQRGDQKRLPDIHETDAEEHLEAADYVDPVSAFSGSLAQFYVDSAREKAVLERITARVREVNIGRFDDSSLPSENEEWDDRLHGESHSGRIHVRHEDFVSQAASFSGRESGSGEIEEPFEPIFPLTRRCPKSGGQFVCVSKVGEEHPSPDEEIFSFKVVKDPNAEIVDNDDSVLGTHDGSWSSRGDSNRFLSRIREEEFDQCDVFPPHEDDSRQHLCNSPGSNGSHAICSPLFHSFSESPDAVEDSFGHSSQEQEAILLENRVKVANEVGERSEADKLESNIMFKDDRDFALREGRDVESFFGEDRILCAEPEDSNGVHFSGSNCANVWRLQLHKSGEGYNQWESQHAMSEGGSLDEENGNMGPINGGPMATMLDEEGPVVCHGLDHADSQGLNKTNLRLRSLINWLIDALLKLRHPAKFDTHGTSLVHIYGPEVHFDRGHAVAFNLFDWNGVPVRAELVQRLADRSNISLGLGSLSNIVYPEGLTDLAGLFFNRSLGGGNNEGSADPPRASKANMHDHPSEIPVVTAALGFVSTFEDVYRLWDFVAKFLDADFVKREVWLYHSLNQEILVL